MNIWISEKCTAFTRFAFQISGPAREDIENFSLIKTTLPKVETSLIWTVHTKQAK